MKWTVHQVTTFTAGGDTQEEKEATFSLMKQMLEDGLDGGDTLDSDASALKETQHDRR